MNLELHSCTSASWEDTSTLFTFLLDYYRKILSAFGYFQLFNYMPQVCCGAVSSTVLADLLQALHIITLDRVVYTKKKPYRVGLSIAHISLQHAIS